MAKTLADLESLTQRIIGCAIEVHRVLGPGLLESIYRDSLVIELQLQHLRVEIDRPVHLDYKGIRLSGTLRLDVVVEGAVVLELKAVEAILPVHSAQVITYLKLTGYPAGLLMNFNLTTLRAGVKRLNHPDLYVKKVL